MQRDIESSINKKIEISTDMELNKTLSNQQSKPLDQQSNKSSNNSINTSNRLSAHQRNNLTNPRSHVSAISHKNEKKATSQQQHNGKPNYYVRRNNLIDGVDDSLLADDLDTGSKKKNLAHLVNFRLAPREQQPYEHEFKRFWSTRIDRNSCFTKEQYLQANCNFVVSSKGGDYNAHFYDPDLLVDWEKIEDIQLNANESPTCPICLYPPVAAKMTKCGHIFCWSCVLHYLSLSDKTWRKCPICFESIYKHDLKSTRISKFKEFKIGDSIELNLMFKQKSNTIALPISLLNEFNRDKPKNLNDFNKHTYDSSWKYLKLRSASPSYIENQVLKREKDELNIQMSQEKDQPESCFISEALNLLKTREELYVKEVPNGNTHIFTSKLPSDTLSISRDVTPKVSYKDAFDDIIENEDKKSLDSCLAVSTIESIEEITEPVKDEVQSHGQAQASPIYADEAFSYFYQSLDGQRIYMNSLNIRCLIQEYKSIVSCPATVKAKIVAIEHIFMNADLRKRFKYLSHLPLHSEFQIVELELTEPLISKETLVLFSEEIESKRKQRLKKEKIEQRMLDRSHTEHERYYTNYSAESHIRSTPRSTSENLLVDYVQDFPQIGLEQQQARAREQTYSTSSSITNESTTNAGVASSPPAAALFSFAQMVRQETVVVDQWPKMSTSLQVAKTQVGGVWGKQLTKNIVSNGSVGTKAASQSVRQSVVDSDFDDDVKPPEFKDTFMSSIDSALKNINKSKSETSDGQVVQQLSRADKKKRRKVVNCCFQLNPYKIIIEKDKKILF